MCICNQYLGQYGSPYGSLYALNNCQSLLMGSQQQASAALASLAALSNAALPETPLRRATTIAAEVRARRPEMQVRRIA